MLTKNLIFKVILLLFGLGFILDLAAKFFAEFIWFQEVDYLSVFQERLVMQTILAVLGLSITIFWLGGNLIIAQHYQYSPNYLKNKPADNLFDLSNQKLPRFSLGLPSLLFIVIGLSLLLGLIIIHYSQIFISYWHWDFTQPLFSTLPEQFEPRIFEQWIKNFKAYIWKVPVLLSLIIAIIWRPAIVFSFIALIFSFGFSLLLSSHWANLLQYFNPTSFNQTEPLLNRDISFYIFSLPIAHLLEFWLMGLFLVGFITCSLIYLLSGNSLSQGRFPSFSQPQQRHLHGLAGLLMFSCAMRYWLARYELLYSTEGVVFGADFSDVNILKPGYLLLSIIAIFLSAFLIWQALFSIKKVKRYIDIILKNIGLYHLVKRRNQRRDKLFPDSYSIRVIFTWYLGFAILVVGIIPNLVQQLIVQPNELERELPYIKHSIKYTRQGFNLDKINVETFDPNAKLSYTDIQNNNLTIDNIRLWDKRPLLQTNRQLQQIRLYYEFSDADYDRYSILPDKFLGKFNTGLQKQQVLIAPRELNYELVPEKAKTWVNEHLVYTHGYGFTLSPVNRVAEGGLPEFFVKNIGADPRLDQDTTLEVSPRIQNIIPIGKPRLYYGLLTNTQIMTSTQVKELDFPLGNENVYNTYDGEGGIVIGTGWKRLLFAYYLKNWQMLFTNNFTPETKLLFRRNILERVKAIAPFLHYDSNPYLVVADSNFPSVDHNYLYWMIDAYTTSNMYPYSDPEGAGFNYIRNSVKVIVDAYNGKVKFYYLEADKDPIISTTKKIFPTLFTPIEQMPITLRQHIRYPIDLFSVQSQHLLTYHMSDPIVFYNREDLWRVPVEIYGSQQQPMEPYYLIMRLPTEKSEEFMLMLPFTPASRNNLIAWLAARSDLEHYGTLLLYRFPKQRLIFGPEQVEALINQEPEISEQISLWSRQGSRVIQGNLLVIPIEQSLLYVEPLYLEAEANSLPTLVRVIVASENRVVMRPTLEEALRDVFQVPPIQPSAPLLSTYKHTEKSGF
ncbi:MAG TPA: hypothetical protein DDZ60_03485, partial [Planktothrix sp. UBA10369]|jgi:Uncharacterized conserved protein|nr:hypothetical protein [Planktothrix sp. UBA10369]